MDRIVLVIGPRQLADLLFWQQAGRALAARKSHHPLLVVHACGESVERLLEGDGMDLQRPLIPDTPLRSALLARGIREEGRRIVNQLAEDGVAAVGFLGSDRGLVREGGDGIEVSNVAWVTQMIDGGTVVLVASVTEAADGCRELATAETAAALAHTIGGSQAVLIGQSAAHSDEFTLQQARAAVDAPEALDALLQAGLSVRISAISDLSQSERLPGVPVSAKPLNRPKK